MHRKLNLTTLGIKSFLLHSWAAGMDNYLSPVKGLMLCLQCCLHEFNPWFSVFGHLCFIFISSFCCKGDFLVRNEKDSLIYMYKINSQKAIYSISIQQNYRKNFSSMFCDILSHNFFLCFIEVGMIYLLLSWTDVQTHSSRLCRIIIFEGKCDLLNKLYCFQDGTTGHFLPSQQMCRTISNLSLLDP